MAKTTTFQMPFRKRVQWRIVRLLQLGYAPTTAKNKAYSLEALLREMKHRVVELHVGADKATGRDAMVIRATVKGNKRLQNQSPKHDTLIVINADTAEKMELSIRCTFKTQEIFIYH